MEHVADVGRRRVRERLEGHERERRGSVRSSRSTADVHVILGGSLKGGGFAELAPPVAARAAACYLIGEAEGQLAEDLADTGVELVRCGDLERAVREAAARAQPGEVVLLSPACASFDQYRDFEERGEHFRALVRELS